VVDMLRCPAFAITASSLEPAAASFVIAVWRRSCHGRTCPSIPAAFKADFAVDRAEESLLAAIDAKRDSLLRDTDKNLQAVGDDYRDCVEKLLEVRQRRDQLGSLRFWIEGFPHQTTQLSTRPRSVAGIKKQNGQPVTGVELAAALREDAAETPAPKANTMPIPPELVSDAAA
jgi:hypothetical protein